VRSRFAVMLLKLLQQRFVVHKIVMRRESPWDAPDTLVKTRECQRRCA
jgi:hypothetical protein